jgi:type I restriction enzyme S subunit
MTAAWPVRKLGDVCHTGSGGTPLNMNDDYYENGTILWLMSGEVSQGEIRSATRFITKKGLENSAARLFPEDTVLVAMYGATAGHVGILKFEAATNQAVCGILPGKTFIPEFLFYFMLSKKEELVAQATGNAQPNISQIKIRNTEVPVPTLAEQKRIVGILDEAFHGIATAKANAEKSLRNARCLFQSHLREVFTQRGDRWTKDQIGSVCDIRHGFAFDGTEFSNGVPAGNPLIITPGNFTEDGKLLFNERNTKRFSGQPPTGVRFEIGDLVVVMTDLSSKMKILGKPAFIESKNILHNQRIGRFVFHNERINKRFLYYFMMTENFLANIKASATGTMVKHTAPKRILSNFISFPLDVTEQLAVVAKFDALRAQTQRLESIYKQKLASLDNLKQSLLKEALAGQLSDQLPEFALAPPASTKGSVTPINLHAGILAMAHQMHEKHGKLQLFTHVKAEKIAHMIEARLGFDLGRKPVKDAAGPNDFNHLNKVEHRARNANYFDFKRVDGGAYSVQKLDRFDRLIAKTHAALDDRLPEVERLLRWMLPMKVQQAEIVATVFAAWNNLLLDGTTPTDEQIVHEARENWHANKLNIERQKFFAAVKWLREQGVVPEGKGKRVADKAK